MVRSPQEIVGVTVTNAKVLQHQPLRMVARSGAPESGR
jgi:hypothetical protein